MGISGHLYALVHVQRTEHNFRSSSAMWALGNRLRSFSLVVSAFTYWVILPAPNYLCLQSSHYNKNVLIFFSY